jgi:hypothetical protein
LLSNLKPQFNSTSLATSIFVAIIEKTNMTRKIITAKAEPIPNSVPPALIDPKAVL